MMMFLYKRVWNAAAMLPQRKHGLRTPHQRQ
jgi:hypothetical protein